MHAVGGREIRAPQRAIARSIGPSILPFRDKIEGWAKELSGTYPGDLVAPGAPYQAIRQSPGVYLRLRMSNAKSPKDIRKAARVSLHDGFTSCLFVNKEGVSPTEGPPCTVTANCEPG